LRSFIAWVGGKRQLAKQIVSLIPEHRAYVEPFSGAAWVLFAKPKEISRAEILNDLNEDLINLLRVARDRLAGFYCQAGFLLSSRAEFRDLLERTRRRAWTDDVDRAVAFYYLLRNSYGGRGTDYYSDRHHPARYKADRDLLEAVREWLRGVFIECQDFEKLIGRCDRPDTFFYCDPPYTVTSKGGYYDHEFKEADHRRLAQLLRGIKGQFLLSYDDAPLVRELYGDFTIEQTAPVTYTRNNRRGQPMKQVRELLIRNY